MTTPKSKIVLPNRTPSYVSREVGAAEVGISPATWDTWVKSGVLPPAAPGAPESTPRWRWTDVDNKLSGKQHYGETGQKTGDLDPGIAGARNLCHGSPSQAQDRAA